MDDRDLALRLAGMVRDRPPRAGGTRVVAVDGRSGAGKTTLARALAVALEAPVVALEELYGGWDGLADGARRLVDDVLAPLAADGRVTVPRYDWPADRWEDGARLVRPAALVVEGVGAGSRAAARYLGLLVWVQLDDATRRRRALRRDRGAYEPHWERWAAQEETYLALDDPRSRADVVLEG